LEHLARPRAGRPERAPPRRPGQGVGLDAAGRLAGGDRDPRRGHPPGAPARSHLRARPRRGRGDAPVRGEVRVVDDPAGPASELLAEAAGKGGHVVLTGGSTPKAAYERAAGLLDDWSAVELWF